MALDDFVEAMVRAIDDGSMAGLYHVTSSNPITNAEMMATYREVLGRRVGLPAPAPVTYLGAILLGSDLALALTGRRCVPARLLDECLESSIPTFREAAAKVLAATGRECALPIAWPLHSGALSSCWRHYCQSTDAAESAFRYIGNGVLLM